MRVIRFPFLPLVLVCAVTKLAAATTTIVRVDPAAVRDDASATPPRFRSLTAARDFVRKLPAAVRRETVEIRLASGVHPVTETLVFGLEDSPPAPGRLVIRSEGHKPAILRGSIPVTGWKKPTEPPADLAPAATGHVWVASFPAGVPDKVFALFGAHGRLPRSRSGLVQVYGKPAGYPGTWTPNRQFSFKQPGLFRAWQNFTDVELAIVPARQFMMNKLELATIDEKAAVVSTKLPGSFQLIPYSGGVPEPCWIENSLAYLDTPGEWASDSARRLLYFWPRSEAELAEVRAAAVVEFVRVEGRVQPHGDDVPVRGIDFRDLVLTESNRYLWQERSAGLQHDWELHDAPNAMLRFRGATDCAVEGCRFVDGGSTGMRLDLFAQKVRVIGNQFSRLGGGGILLAGYGPGTKDVNRGNEIADNAIDHIGEDYRVSPGIMIYQSGANHIHHNLVHDVPYIGIVLSGAWPNDWLRGDSRERARTIRRDETEEIFQRARRESQDQKLGDVYIQKQLQPFLHGRDNVVDHNEVFAYMLKQGDGNGIYIAGCGPGNVIRENYVHDTLGNTASYAIRTDDLQWGTQIVNNLIVNVACGGLTLKHVNTFDGNILVNLQPSEKIVHSYVIVQRGPVRGSSLSNNVFFYEHPAGATEPPVWFVENRGGAAAAVLDDLAMDGNLYWTPRFPEQARVSLADVQRRGKDPHGVAADPRFRDAAAGDYRFAEDSPMRARGLRGLHVDETGPQAPWRDRFYGGLRTRIEPSAALTTPEHPVAVRAIANKPGAVIRYTLDQSEPTKESPVFRPTTMTRGALLRVRAFLDGERDTRGALAAIHEDSPAYVWDLGDVPIGSTPPHPLKIQGDAAIIHTAAEDRVIRLASSGEKTANPSQLALARPMRRGRIEIKTRFRISAEAKAAMQVSDVFSHAVALQCEFAAGKLSTRDERVSQPLPADTWIDAVFVADLDRGEWSAMFAQSGRELFAIEHVPAAARDLASVNWFAWTLDPTVRGTMEFARIDVRRLGE